MSWLDGLRHRLRVLVAPEAYEAEVAEERRFHREMEERHGRRDSDFEPQSAAFASPHGPRPSRRRSSWIERSLHDLRYATRGLLRSPGFTSIALVTLALGVGANAAVFSMLDRLYSQPPKGVRDPDSLIRVYTERPGAPGQPGRVSRELTLQAITAIEDAGGGAYDMVAWVASTERPLNRGDRELLARTSFVTHDYFSVLGVGAQRGRVFGEDERSLDVISPVAVITDAFWERAFARDPGILGQTLHLDSLTYTVVGVLDPGFSGLELSYTDVYFPLSGFSAVSPVVVGGYLLTAARLHEGVDDAQFMERATAGYLRREPDFPGRRYFPGRRTVDTTEVVLAGSIIETRGIGRRVGNTDRQQAVTVSTRAIGVSAILLVVACANVSSLLLVRANKRRREIGVRLALGVSRVRLGAQLLTEGVLLALGAGTAAVIVATVGGRLLRRTLLPEVAWAEPAVDPRTLAFAMGTAAVVGLLAGLAPALQSRTVDVSTSLKAGAIGLRSTGARSLFRSSLIATQAALSVVLLVGAGLFLTSLDNARAIRLGFDVDGLAYISNVDQTSGPPDERAAIIADIAARLATIPGVTGTAITDHPPMEGIMSRRVVRTDDAEVEGSSYHEVSPSFFEVMGTRILEGRGFVDGDVDRVVIVDETMAQAYWPGRSALGQCLYFEVAPDGACWEIVGVAEDQRATRVIGEEPTFQFFLPIDTAETTPFRAIVFRVDPRRWDHVAPAVLETVSARLNMRGVRVSTVSDLLEPQFRPWRVGSQLFVVFGLLALLVTAVGVYGVMAYAISQRRHEMGVRIALGARLNDILELVLSDGLRLVGVGVVLGVVASLALGRLVESLLYGVTPSDPGPMAGAATVLLVAGALATLVPALRAGRVDPAEVLRQE